MVGEFLDGHGIYPVGALQPAVAEVMRDQVTLELLRSDHGAGAPGVEPMVRRAWRQRFLRDPRGNSGNRLRVGRLHRLGTAHGNGFQILRSHDRAQARATGHLVEIVNDAGKPHQVFPGRTDLGHANARIAQLIPDLSFHRSR